MPFRPRPRLVLVHGSVVDAAATWRAQELLAQEFEIVVPNRRGFPPGPEVAAVDFEDEAGSLLERIGVGVYALRRVCSASWRRRSSASRRLMYGFASLTISSR